MMSYYNSNINRWVETTTDKVIKYFFVILKFIVGLLFLSSVVGWIDIIWSISNKISLLIESVPQ